MEILHPASFAIDFVVDHVRSDVLSHTGNKFANYDKQFAALFYLTEMVGHGPNLIFSYTRYPKPFISESKRKRKRIDKCQTTIEECWLRQKKLLFDCDDNEDDLIIIQSDNED